MGKAPWRGAEPNVIRPIRCMPLSSLDEERWPPAVAGWSGAGDHPRVLTGAIYVSDRLAAKMLQQQVRGQNDISESPVKGLSDRELEVFQLIGQWKKTREIAEELHLSIKTIEYYREQIKRKLNLKNAGELTQYATAWVQREIPT